MELVSPREIVFAVYNADARGSVMWATRRQAEFLADVGYRITVISNREPVDWDGVEYVPAATPDSPLWRAIAYAVDGIGRRLPQSWRRWDLRDYVRQYRFDHSLKRGITELSLKRDLAGVICCQHFCVPALVALQKQRNLPFVIVSHGDIFSHPSNAFPLALSSLYRRTARLAYSHATRVIVVGSQLRERAVECGARREQVAVIPNGIDLSDITATEQYALERKAECELLYVGRLAPEKAVHVLIEALALVRAPSIRLRIVGSGPCEADLRTLVSKRKVTSNVEFVGAVGRHELAAYYRSSDVVVLPSLTEAQGVVILEALVTGRPVIASNVGGVPDVVRHLWNGLLVETGDVRGFAAAVEQLAQDHALRRIMGEKAKSLSHRFAWQVVLEKFHATISAAFARSDNVPRDGGTK